jgi:hypothetical protein
MTVRRLDVLLDLGGMQAQVLRASLAGDDQGRVVFVRQGSPQFLDPLRDTEKSLQATALRLIFVPGR